MMLLLDLEMNLTEDGRCSTEVVCVCPVAVVTGSVITNTLKFFLEACEGKKI